MRRNTMVGAANLARAAVVLALIAGCSPEPSPSATQALPISTPAASAASGLGIAWEPYLRLGGMVDMVHGGGGWVALGECEAETCDTEATLWHSPDLEAWETIALPQSGDILPISISANTDRYLVAAYDFDDMGGHNDAFLQVWRSTDGRLWQRVGELRLGSCTGRDCPGVRGVGLAPNGSVVVGAVTRDGNGAGQAWFSDYGDEWREMTVATFSNGARLDRIVVHGVEPTPSDLFLIGSACGNTCAMTVWSTTDGEHWAEEQSFGPDADGLSIAADGGQRVAAVATCASPFECTTDVWTGVRSTAWINVLPALDLADPQVIWTGDVFVLVGVRDDRFVNYASVDGLSWTELPGDVLGARGSCGDTWLAGAAREVMFGVPECALWQGTVRLAR